MTGDPICARYQELLGQVPATVEQRLTLAEAVGHPEAIAAIEAWRHELLHRNVLDRKTQQVVHFALLIGAGQDGPAALHARGALKAGATARELFGVATTAAVTGGMPAFSRAVAIITAALDSAD